MMSLLRLLPVFVIMDWIIIHFGRKPRNAGSPPRDSSDVNIMNFISVASLFVIKVWLINDASRFRTFRPDPARKLSANLYDILLLW